MREAGTSGVPGTAMVPGVWNAYVTMSWRWRGQSDVFVVQTRSHMPSDTEGLKLVGNPELRAEAADASGGGGGSSPLFPLLRPHSPPLSLSFWGSNTDTATVSFRGGVSHRQVF